MSKALKQALFEIEKLTDMEMEKVKESLTIKIEQKDVARIINDNRPNCPSCGSSKSKKYGILNRYQRYKCHCGKVFNSRSGTAFSHIHMDHKWLKFIELMNTNLSLSKIALELKVNRKTIYRWRNKLACGLGFNSVISGVIEADVTEFAKSSKGKKLVDRKPRKRAEKGCEKVFF